MEVHPMKLLVWEVFKMVWCFQMILYWFTTNHLFAGMLKVSINRYGHSVLPVSDTSKPCSPLKKGLKCFEAGDNRVNQHPLLTLMHTIWVRNHNVHAASLQRVNPAWSDEKLYQEARRLTIAELQHITYAEYLPVILGSVLSSYYSLTPLQRGYTYYEANTDPTSWNEFGLACRFGHSQISDYYRLTNIARTNTSFFLLKDNFFEPGFVHDGLVREKDKLFVKYLLNRNNNDILSNLARRCDSWQYRWTAEHSGRQLQPNSKKFCHARERQTSRPRFSVDEHPGMYLISINVCIELIDEKGWWYKN